jgi:hypothetical protein
MSTCAQSAIAHQCRQSHLLAPSRYRLEGAGEAVRYRQLMAKREKDRCHDGDPAPDRTLCPFKGTEFAKANYNKTS